ncbi:SusC/RagA family TonB-linked outer membrane protein [Mucilaginibacter rubeus]|uniref:SusC/RagA family TonB-linked outer membrane protein n=2 Tax=Sphingobacteriaceae TaxID=84566 RepID=A0AAE6JP78_9SPHI|nr:SusC/RagA family TonB-linked outer membrane protein [Mucilaginibacter rubeus]QEM20626.1 SusC/RagA family TonB-linked outer membrane protein [Mucilaginibacter gossypii]QTE47115.1 SusC/RagA family TonB-linked outer membrane protein [Mucilaginibacter rubeus]QTE53718.1 SusC/RagA family TonB-linked outer membrane protein [Mucilaginibacter rubeus]QTE60220.1 SusC/RagA family TonB-linked outer membrane protein [Mucilaginibacter rubeus]
MLKDAFLQIEKSGDISISYNNSLLDDKRKVHVTKAERSLGETLDLLLKGTTCTYRAAGERNILIIAKTQDRGSIRGKVVDEKSEPLPGATVRVPGTGATAISGVDGSYTLNIVPGTYTVEASFISYETKRIQNVSVSSNANTVLNITLSPADNKLNEVVVTALGIKREDKSLGYSAPVIKGDQLTGALAGNWTDALSGKVAGLNLIRSNSGPAGSNKIILRGENNLTGDNEALIVVDGVVINQGSGRRTSNSGESAYGTSSDNMPADYGSNLNDINPEDIETVTVLKGPGAAALYGQRGANGAIIITTKSGKKHSGLGITFNSNASLESVNRWPDLQYEYGQGTAGSRYYSYGAGPDGASTSSTSSAYGPKFDGQLFYQLDSVTQKQSITRTPWVPYKNQIRDFFDVGQTFTNSVSVDGGSDKTTARFSATNVTNHWITPNTGYTRNSIALSVNSKINDKLTINAKVNYNNKNSDNLPGAGYGNQSLMYWFIFWQPNANLNWLKNYWKNGQDGKAIFYPFSSFPENPYAVSYEFINKSNRNSVTGNVEALYNVTKEFSVQVRATLDMGYEQRAQQRPYDAGTKYPKGSYRTQNIYSEEQGADFLLKYNKKITHDVNITATAGGSMLRNNYNRDEVRADSLVYPGVYSMANNAGPLVTLPYKSKYAINSFYGLLSTSFKDYLYVDLTARQDWISTLATANRTDQVGFFYPSASMSFLPSEAFKLPKFIDYAKVRASLAGVGSGTTNPYQTSFNYVSAGSTYAGGLQNPRTLSNPDLKPLRTTTLEIGAETRMFNNRLGFDIALYSGNTKNQILSRTVDQSSGYSQAVINVGKVSNKGIEISLNGTPIRKANVFSWNVTATFSANKNTIEQLADSAVVLRNGPTGGGQIVARVGGSMGDMYGRGYLRSPDGQIVYDESTGFAKLSNDLVYLGNTIPKWKASMGHDFRYKQFNLHLLFDAQVGGVSYSLSNYKLAEQGKTTLTLPGRYNGIIGKGVIQNADGSYRPNDVIATDIDGYYRSHYGIDNAEGNTFSTNFLKFREARFDYSLSPRLVKRLGLTRATVGVYGRDLYIWTKWPIFDPEFGTLSGSDIVQGFEIAQFPSTRTFGFNIVIGI